MALVSPGVQVTVTDESFFIPAQAPTVPLIFIATADEKLQTDGVSPAAGTFESGVVRTITSLQQSVELYGVPNFLEDVNGNAFHGDARNEYGLLALNQFLGIGNRAFTIRANVNLNDDLDDLRTSWSSKFNDSGSVLQGLAQDLIDEFNTENGLIASDPIFKTTISDTEIITLAQTVTEDIFDQFSFQSLEDDFFDDHTIPSSPTAGFQIVNYGGAVVGGNPTGLVDDAAGFHVADLGGNVLVADPTGLAGDTNAFQVVDVGGAKTLTSLTGLDDSTGGTQNVDVGAVTGITSTGLTGDTAGVQEVDVGVITGATATGLANNATVFTATIEVDNSTVLQAISFTGASAQIYSDLVNQINGDLAGAVASVTGGTLLVTSNTTGATSAIDIQDTDLFSSLAGFVAVNGAADGFAELTYAANVVVDGGAAQDISVGGNTVQTFADLVNEINLDVTGASSAIVSGDVLFTSDTTGVASTILLEDGATAGAAGAVPQVQDVTAVADVAGSLDGTYFVLSSPATDYYVWFNVDAGGNDPSPLGLTGITVTVATGDADTVVAGSMITAIDAELDFGAVAALAVVTITQANDGVVTNAKEGPASNATGFTFSAPSALGEGLLASLDGFIAIDAAAAGTDGATYTASVQFDALGVEALSVDGVNVTTYNDLIAEVQSIIDLGLGGGSITLTSGNLRFISATTGVLSDVDVLDTDLFSSLTDFVAVDLVVPGQTTYEATVEVDGGGPQAIAIIGTVAQIFTDLLTELDTDLTGATSAITNGNLRITSGTVGSSSSILITDITSGTPGTAPLLANLSAFQGLNTATAGTNALTYTATVTIDGTPNALAVGGDIATTFTLLLVEINTQLTGATATIDAGNIKIESDSTGALSIILIVDTGTLPLFSSTTGFGTINTAVAGTDSDSTLPIFGNGFAQPSTGSYLGFEGSVAEWVTNTFGSTVGKEDEWSPQESNDFLLDVADDFQFTAEFLNGTSLGANDAARRLSIVTALQAAVNSNTEIRSENFEYNLILCPGYFEVVDELIALTVDIGEEAFVVAETPMDRDPEQTVSWADTDSARQHSVNVAYYYSHPLLSNLDGKNVVGAASGTALRTYAFSDNASEIWFAPAGTRRGLVSGVSQVGFVSGTLGSATTFVEVNLNVGQRDDLYKFFTNINPITNIPGRGILVFGQKTSSPDASALDRVNVSRLVGFLRRQLRKNTLSFVFEPNDQLTRDNLKAAVDAFLGDILIRRGLFDFVSVSDESNNTPDRIDRNEMYIDIAIQPTKAAEFLFIPIRIVATSAELS